MDSLSKDNRWSLSHWHVMLNASIVVSGFVMVDPSAQKMQLSNPRVLLKVVKRSMNGDIALTFS